MASPANKVAPYVTHDGLMWPSSDECCHDAIKRQIPDIQEVLRYTDGRELCVQAGGNVGIWPFELSAHFARVLTFEPDPDNFHCLQHNLRHVHNVEMRKAALGDKQGIAGLHRVPQNVGAHWITEGANISVMTIDKRSLYACDLIYLDIEGMELHALWGAEKTIERFFPTICIEDKGLSRKFGVRQYAAEEWLALRFGYRVVERLNRDVVLRRDA